MPSISAYMQVRAAGQLTWSTARWIELVPLALQMSSCFADAPTAKSAAVWLNTGEERAADTLETMHTARAATRATRALVGCIFLCLCRRPWCSSFECDDCKLIDRLMLIERSGTVLSAKGGPSAVQVASAIALQLDAGSCIDRKGDNDTEIDHVYHL
jgi:hypothetical protein